MATVLRRPAEERGQGDDPRDHCLAPDTPKQFDPVKVRTALREYAFNYKRRTNPEVPIPHEVRVILEWVQRNTLSMAAWE
ncbi:hypothetical protein [Streptomyces sp. ITFR-6]|uniref:hypothetical protein n=1 Tax=Streptomyces sp. ITFR-6 TaxID=3075197 RepID=UPI0028899BC8|nr:hypothetical protein [Streptomyces sp. ITFR-6]WNI31877.1 hypothetical protein RLT59_26125 [Streptomyces sp. ITFR-6]